MKRRSFLKSASVVSVPIMLGGIQVSAIPNSPFRTAVNGSDKVLILVQLNGGNDGLADLLIRYDDLAGNQGVEVSLTSDDSFVIFDSFPK